MTDEPQSHLMIAFLLLLLSSQPVHGYGVVSGYFKPSVSSEYPYKWYYMEWVDYCPACGHHGVLQVNPKGTYEGELTCMRCDADYCGVTGLDKGGKRWRLTRAVKPLFHGVDLELHYQSITRT